MIQAPSLGSLLQQVLTVKALSIPSNPEASAFRALWSSLLDQAYEAPASQVLDLLILNREVAVLAPLPAAQEIRRQALANTARLSARLGELPPRGGAEALERPEEREWLAWCRWWFQGRNGPVPALQNGNPTEIWEFIRKGCQLLSEETPDPLALAAYSRFSEGEESNTPLSYLRRLARLVEAEQWLAGGHWEEAHRVAIQAGPDGERLAQQAIWGAGLESISDVQDFGKRARYQAYRARRLAERLELLVFSPASLYWRREQEAWRQLADHMKTWMEVNK